MIASRNALLRYRIIDRCIRSTTHPFPNKEYLRSKCEEELFGSTDKSHISDSTIEKDLFAMRMENDAPIAYSRADRGYYYTDDEYQLEGLPLNEKDIDAIKVAATVLEQFKGAPIFQQFGGAIEKILNRLSISENINDQAIDNYVQFELLGVASGGEFLEVLLKAIKEKRKIQFNYQSFNAKDGSVRRVHPYLLKEYRQRWYLICRNEMKDMIQTFAFDRMSNLEVLSETFEKDKSFNPDNFFKYSLGITSNVGAPEKIVIQVNELLSKYLLSQPLHFSQELVSSKNDEFIFSYFLLPTYELKTAILGFGSEVVVLEPKTLADEIRDAAVEVASKYQ